MTRLKVATGETFRSFQRPQLPRLLRRTGDQPGRNLAAVHRAGTARPAAHRLRHRPRYRHRLPVPAGARLRRLGRRHLGSCRQAQADDRHAGRDDVLRARPRRVRAERPHHRHVGVRAGDAHRHRQRVRQPVAAGDDHRARRRSVHGERRQPQQRSDHRLTGRSVPPSRHGSSTASASAGASWPTRRRSWRCSIALVLIDPAELHAAERITKEKGQILEGFRYVWQHDELRLAMLMMARRRHALVQLAGPAAAAGRARVPRRCQHLRVHHDGVQRRIAGRIAADRPAHHDGQPAPGPHRDRSRPRQPARGRRADAARRGAGGALAGASGMAFLSATMTALQFTSIPAMRGRVMALYTILFLGSTPIGGPLAGWIAQVFGTRWSIALGAVAAVGSGFVGLVALRRRPERRSRWPLPLRPCSKRPPDPACPLAARPVASSVAPRQDDKDRSRAHVHPEAIRHPACLARRRCRRPGARPGRDRGRADPAGQAQADLRSARRHRRPRDRRQRRQDRAHRGQGRARSSSTATPAIPVA